MNTPHIYHITGRNAGDLQIVAAPAGKRLTCRSRASGTHREMAGLLKFAVRKWPELPRGLEIETAAKLMPPDALELERDDAAAPPAPAAARRRAGCGDFVAVLI